MHDKPVPMTVYDVTVDVKGINESETHTLRHVVVLRTVSKLTDHLPLNAVVNKFEYLREKRIHFPALHRHCVKDCHRVGPVDF